MTDPFFIVGTDRSGSTMLRLMVNQHHDLAVPNESWFILDLFDRLPHEAPFNAEQKKLAFEIITEHPRWADWGVSNEQFRDELERAQLPRLADILEIAFRLETSADVRWGDKTPGYLDHIEQLHRIFPRAQFVHIIRDPRDVCISLLSKKWRGSETWTIARYWRDAVTAGREQGRALPPALYHEVIYESLVRDPEPELRRMCEFLGHDFDPAMLNFHEDVDESVLSMQSKHHAKTKRSPQASDAERWRTELSPERLGMIEAVTGPVMESFGYARAYRGIRRIVPLGLLALLQLSEKTLPLRRRFGIHFPGLRQRL